MQLKHETSTSTLGSVNGKKSGRRRISALLAEHGAGEHLERPLEVRQGDVGVDRESLDLVELRRVRGVGRVGPVHAPGDDDVQRRRVALHRPDLHGARVRPQQHLVGHVERVGLLPRRVRWWGVERGEVVKDGLDLGSLRDVEPEADEHLLDLPARLRQQVQPAEVRERVGRERDVDPVLLEPCVQLFA